MNTTSKESAESSLKNFYERLDKCGKENINRDFLEEYIENPGMLDSILGMGPVMVYILNYQTFDFEYISPNFESQLGIPTEELKEKGLVNLQTNYYHPADASTLSRKVFPDLLEVMRECPGDRKLNSKTQFNFRLKNAHDQWFHIIQQSVVLEVDATGSPLLDLTVCTNTGLATDREDNIINLIIHRQTEEGSFKVSFSKSYSVSAEWEATLTNRELEILQHIARGQTSKEIAVELSISENTVNTHRRKMLRKLRVKSSSELIRLAVKSGMV